MNITKIVKEYIGSHLSIKDCLKKDIINFSALSREIAKHAGIDLNKHFDALNIACRRYKEKMKYRENEDKIKKLLKTSKVHVRTKVTRIIIEKDYLSLQRISRILESKALLHIVQGESNIMLITEEEFVNRVKYILKPKIIDIKRNLAELTIISSPIAENTIGLTAYITSLLSDAGINIIMSLGSYTDDIYIIGKKEISRALAVIGNS
ncbi:MAG: ACT domain-containing protein [Candidatus Micrarchaeota archaeon]|nr:ACT domain-containing protein [Candidatus Micrarchaeota archaeon]